MSEPTLNDCINYMRSQIKQMEKYPRSYEFNLPYYRKTVELLEDERPRGKWIFHKYDKNYECSNCHVRFDQTQIYTEKRFESALWAKMEIYHFCPNCGADMRKEGGEE